MCLYFNILFFDEYMEQSKGWPFTSSLLGKKPTFFQNKLKYQKDDIWELCN